MIIPSTDQEFEAFIVKEVTSTDPKGWFLVLSNSWGVFVPNARCGVSPSVGESIRLFGKGIGYPIRGITIEGRVYKYETPEEHEASQEDMLRKLKEQQEAEDAEFRASKKPPLATFKLRDEEGWAECVKNNSGDPYGFRILQYAADWASFMERDLIPGMQISDVAEKTSREADTDGITGFMYGAAVSMLSEVWEHGEALRRWHNLKTQVRDEGERANETGAVLNPAILNIG
jgi:hypothetical protein